MAILNFSGGAAFQPVSECPFNHQAGIRQIFNQKNPEDIIMLFRIFAFVDKTRLSHKVPVHRAIIEFEIFEN